MPFNPHSIPSFHSIMPSFSNHAIQQPIDHFGLMIRPPANHLSFWHDSSCTPFTVVMVKVRKMRMRTAVNLRCSNANAGMPPTLSQYSSHTSTNRSAPLTSPKNPSRYGNQRKRPSQLNGNGFVV